MPAGTIAVPPGGRASTSSDFALATASIDPSCSTCAAPIVVITPTRGRANAQSSAIWPGPRMASSRMQTSVSGSSRQSVRGTPISLFRLSSAATMRARGRQIAARMSFVEVFPAEPVMPTTRAPLRSRTAPPSAARAAKPSPGRSAAAAPRCRASSANRAPAALTPTNRSPDATSRESTWTPVIRSVPAAAVRWPEQSSATSPSVSAITSVPRDGGERRGQPRGRRTEPSCPPTPAPVRAPCRRRGRRRLDGRPRSPARSPPPGPPRPRSRR